MSVNVATAIGVKNGTELVVDVVRGEDLLHIRRSGAEREVVLRPVDGRRDLRVAAGGEPAVRARVSAKAAFTRGSPKNALSSEPMTPRTTCRGFFGDPCGPYR